jgi:probable rRNA maturation factor
MKARPPIYFHYTAPSFYFPARQALKRFLQGIAKKEGHALQTVNYIFCTDEELLPLNQQYLRHHTLTDIITFHYHQPGEPILSDIYISVERVRENALQFQTSFTKELHRVIFHGLLHLCGYGDKTNAQTTLMRQKEDQYLGAYLNQGHP